MDSAQLAALAAAVIVVFWMLGAYNRLMALRNGIGSAFAKLDDGLVRAAEVALALAAALRGAMANEQRALDALVHTCTQLQAAVLRVRGQAASALAAAAVTSAMAEFGAAGSRVRALAEQQQAPANDAAADVAKQLAAWRDADVRIAFARQLFNDAVNRYNEAARQFPTRLLARLFGLTSAGLV